MFRSHLDRQGLHLTGLSTHHPKPAVHVRVTGYQMSPGQEAMSALGEQEALLLPAAFASEEAFQTRESLQLHRTQALPDSV